MIHIFFDIFIFTNKSPHNKRNLSMKFSRVFLQSLKKKLRENLIRENTLVLAACAHSIADVDEDYRKLDISCYHTLRF